MTFTMVGERFNFGVDIDDMWRFAGLPDPPSIVIPFLVYRPTRNGRFSLPNERGVRPRRYGEGNFTDSLIYRENRHNTRKLTRAVAALLKANGIDYVRCWFPWNFFEPEIGSGFCFPLDYFVEEMNDAGIGLIAVVGDGYKRFMPSGAASGNIEEYVEQLYRSSSKIVRHYKGRVDAWQIENEPNAWLGHAMADWRSGSIWLRESSKEPILSVLHEVVAKEAPCAPIAINIDYIGLKTDWKRYAKYCNVLGIDFYQGYANPFYTRLSAARKIVDEAYAATQMPVYIMETGYASGPGMLGYNEKRQRDYINSACVAAFSDRRVNGLGIYRFADSYWKSFPTMENHFGLLDVHGKPKPAWGAYAHQIARARKGEIPR